jgi:hypothetical protein
VTIGWNKNRSVGFPPTTKRQPIILYFLKLYASLSTKCRGIVASIPEYILAKFWVRLLVQKPVTLQATILSFLTYNPPAHVRLLTLTSLPVCINCVPEYVPAENPQEIFHVPLQANAGTTGTSCYMAAPEAPFEIPSVFVEAKRVPQTSRQHRKH